MTAPIYHLVPAGYFYSLPPDQPYLTPDFAREGFIHCTGTPEIVHLVANDHLRQVPGDFLVLTIDPDRLVAPLKWEPAPAPPGAPAGTIEFPHIYGLLNRDAITDIRRMRRHADGTFEPLDRSLQLHEREREMFLTPRAGDERTRAWLVAIAPLLQRFEQAEHGLEAARQALAAQPGAAPGGHIGRMMAETRAHIAELDRQIDYFFAHGTLAGYEAPAAPAPPAPPAPPFPPASGGAGGAGGAEGEELPQLRAAAEAALRELDEGDFDGATARYLTALALASLSTAYFIAREKDPPAPAQLLPALEAQDAELAGWARAVLGVADPGETRRLLHSIFDRAFGAGSQPALATEADLGDGDLLPSPD